MRTLGIDIGEKRIGVAVSDASGRVATPLTVLDGPRAFANGDDLSAIVDEYGIERIVIGMPYSLDGTEGPQARRTRTLAARLTVGVTLPVTFFDERLTSAEASVRMREAGCSEREQRGSKDMVAAAILLQAFLDATSSLDEPEAGRS